MQKYISYITPFNGFILLSLYVLFVVPTTVFHYNSEEFYLSLLKYYLATASITIALLLSIYLLRKVLPKSVKILNTVCIIIGLYIFIVNFIFPIDTGLLDGGNNKISELFTKNSVLQAIGYLLLFMAITLLFKLQTKVINELVNVAIFIGITWVIYIAVTTENYHMQEVTPTEQANQAKLPKNYYALSENKNILVIIFDGLQGNFVYEVLKENPEFNQLFDGFTYFSNTAGVFPFTTPSTANMLLGKISEERYFDVYQDTMEDNMLHDAESSGFTTSAFNIRCSLAPKSKCAHIRQQTATKNLFGIKSSNSQGQLFYTSLMRYTPEILLSSFTSLSRSQKETNNIRKAAISKNALDSQIALDYLSLESLIDNLSIDNKILNAFKFHFYMFTHEPVAFDKKCNYIGSERIFGRDETKDEIICAFNKFGQLINKLKSLKIYDNTLIMLVSDHGNTIRANKQSQLQLGNTHPYFATATDNWEYTPHIAARFYAAMFYKGFNSSGDLKIDNNSPVSLLDIRATLCPYLTACDPSQLSGYPLDQIPANRKRPIVMYHGTKKTYSNLENYRYIEFTDHISKLPYLLADLPSMGFTGTLDFTEKNIPPVLSNNLINRGSGNIWTKDKLIDITFKVDNEVREKGVILNFKVRRAYISEEHPDLSVKLFVNNQRLATSTFNYLSDTSKDREIILDVSHTLVQDEDYLHLRLEIDNPVSPFELSKSKNKNKLGLLLSKITLLEPENKLS